MSDKQNLTDEDYLKLHLQKLETPKSPTNEIKSQVFDQVPQPEIALKSNDLQYFSFDIDEFPCNIFYPNGTIIQVRAAQVKEIQAYSMVDDNNYYDIIEKMNDILSSCVRLKHIDGTFGSYLDLKDPDRTYLVFLIRELTFQKGTILSTTAKCECGKETNIDLHRIFFRKYDIDQKLEPFYDNRRNCFKFELTNNKIFLLAPPTIGIQKAFTEYVFRENVEKRKPNDSFLKIIPFTLAGRTSITQEEIQSELENFQTMDIVSFQFLNSAVEKMNFGIQKLVKKCECGLEIHTRMTFPDGPSAIFVVHDAFDKFIKK